jgi:hypothetical protein
MVEERRRCFGECVYIVRVFSHDIVLLTRRDLAAMVVFIGLIEVLERVSYIQAPTRVVGSVFRLRAESAVPILLWPRPEVVRHLPPEPGCEFGCRLCVNYVA